MKQYTFFEAYKGSGLKLRDHQSYSFVWKEINIDKCHSTFLLSNDLQLDSIKQKDLIQDLVTLGWWMFYLLKFDGYLEAWMKDTGFAFEAGGLAYPSDKTRYHEGKNFDILHRRNGYFFAYYSERVLPRHTLSELIQRIKTTFPIHQFGFDFLLFEGLCLEHPEFFSRNRKNLSLLPHEEDSIRQWLLSQGEATKQLLDKHITKCTQNYDNFQSTVTLFQNKLEANLSGVTIQHFTLCAKSPSGLTTVQIKTIMTRLHAYLKKTGPLTYARKVSYDLNLGLQVDLVIGLNSIEAKTWVKQDLLNHWSYLIDKALGAEGVNVFYAEKEQMTTTPEAIQIFLQTVWLRPCFLDSHIKLHVPLLNNFTTSRS